MPFRGKDGNLARMSATIDPRKAHAAHRFGDIIQLLTWVNDERAMVLMAANRAKSPWFIICESAAYQYDDPRYLANQSRKAAEVMGLDDTTSSWFRIAKIIDEGLPDLIRMPSAMPIEKQAGTFGHMQLKADGVVIHEEDVTYNKEEGATYG